LVSVLNLVFGLQPLFDVAVMKEFTKDLCSVNMPPFRSIHGTLESGEVHGKQVSTLYTLALVSYNW